MNIEQLNRANSDWDNFVDSLVDGEKEQLIGYEEAVAMTKIHQYVAQRDSIKFDQTINKLSNRYLFDQEIVTTVYDYYNERELYELAFDYIKKAEQYLINTNHMIPVSLQKTIDASVTKALLEKYKISLERISSLSPRDIPKITPDIINDKLVLNLFILDEIVQALKIVDEKRESLSQVTHENRYNDFLLGILRLRFPIWGWAIHDQPRLGTSTGGADAGNADLVVESGGNKIALIEAFILKDKDYTETHILKCPVYISSLNNFYVVIYYRGNSSNFNNRWTDYTNDVLAIDYPDDFKIDTTLGFELLNDKFENVVNFKIAKTLHYNNVELFHIMINLR